MTPLAQQVKFNKKVIKKKHNNPKELHHQIKASIKMYLILKELRLPPAHLLKIEKCFILKRNQGSNHYRNSLNHQVKFNT